MSSIASSMVLNGGFVTALTAFSTYLASTSTSRFTVRPGAAAPSVVRSSVSGISDTSKPVVVHRRHGKRHAVDRDRALLDHVAQQLGRGADPHHAREALLAHRLHRCRCRPRAPAPRGRPAGRSRAAAARGSPRRPPLQRPERAARAASPPSRRRRSEPPSGSTRGEAHAVHRDRVAGAPARAASGVRTSQPRAVAERRGLTVPCRLRAR